MHIHFFLKQKENWHRQSVGSAPLSLRDYLRIRGTGCLLPKPMYLLASCRARLSAVLTELHDTPFPEGPGGSAALSAAILLLSWIGGLAADWARRTGSICSSVIMLRGCVSSNYESGGELVENI